MNNNNINKSKSLENSDSSNKFENCKNPYESGTDTNKENNYINIFDDINTGKKEKSREIESTQNIKSIERKETFSYSDEIYSGPNKNSQFISKENSELNKNLKFIEDKNSIINLKGKINKKRERKFIKKKFKRKFKTIKKNLNSKHNKFTSDRINQKIFAECKKSLSKTIVNILESRNIFTFPKKLNNSMENNYQFYKNFCKKTLSEIYCESFPKNLTESEKIEKEKKQNSDKQNNEYEYNKVAIKFAINSEKHNKEVKDKILELLFNHTTFSNILKAFLCNESTISIQNRIIDLLGFEGFNKKTFSYLSDTKKENTKKILSEKLDLKISWSQK